MNGRPIPFARQLSVCPMPTINGEHKAQESPKLLYFADQIIKKNDEFNKRRTNAIKKL